MTETARTAVRPEPRAAHSPAAFDRSLDAVRAAITAAEALGLDAGPALGVVSEAQERLRLPTDALVVALVGGTGVGKSSLLNALAGSTVSAAGVHRPTTAQPVAWLARSEPALDRLLAWVGVTETVVGRDGAIEGTGDGALDGTSDDAGDRGARPPAAGRPPAAAGPLSAADRIAVLDMPDLDSLDERHRRRVEEVLPRADAVVWVGDPEKYADAVLHDVFLRRWAPRLGSQIFVVNKGDLLAERERTRVVDDAMRLLRSNGIEMPVVTATAIEGGRGVLEIRRWLDGLAADKLAAIRRLGASATDAVADLADRAGVGRDGQVPPLVPAALRTQTANDVAERLRTLADPRAVEAIAVEATTRQALDTTGPFATFRVAARSVGLGGGRGHTPRRHLERWRERGSLVRAAAPAVPALREAVSAASPPLRPRLAEAAQPTAVARRLEPLMDGLPAALGDSGSTVPSGRGWGTLGLLQAVAAGIGALAVLWIAASYFVRLPVDLGSAVIVVAVAGVALGILLRLALRQYARIVGRRWAKRLVAAVDASIASQVQGALFAPFDEVEAARQALGRAMLAALAAAAAPTPAAPAGASSRGSTPAPSSGSAALSGF